MAHHLVDAAQDASIRPVRTNFNSLPVELQLEILRCSLVIRAPRIDTYGRLKHALLDSEFSKELVSIQKLVLDVLFHSTVITISSGYIRRSLETSYMDGASRSVHPQFLRLHDLTHGRHKRNLMRLVVRDDNIPGVPDPLYLVGQWQCWARAIGLPWECVDIRHVVRRFLNPYEFNGMSCELSYALRCLDIRIGKEDRFEEAAVRLRYELLEFVRRGDGYLYCPNHQGVNQIGHCLCCPAYSGPWNPRSVPTIEHCRCSQSNSIFWEPFPPNGIQ